MLSIIVAKAKNNIIGKDNSMLWKLPDDLKRFKEKIVKEFNLKSINGECVRDFIRKNSDNPTLRYMINSYIEDLSIGISNIINIFEPEAICLGGSFAEYEGILYEPLKNALINGNLLFTESIVCNFHVWNPLNAFPRILIIGNNA